MLKFLDLKKFTKNLQPVTTPELFSYGRDFHPDGLFSEIIFGPIEGKGRRQNYSYIELGTEVIHPIGYNILMRLDRRIDSLLATTKSFSIDKNGYLIEDEEGELIGFSSFIKNFDKLRFRTENEMRKKLANVIYESFNEGTLFIDRIPVLPPDFRPAFQDENGRWMIDPINDIYQSIIRLSFQLKATHGHLKDLLSYNMQTLIMEHDDYMRSKIEKKNGLIRSQILGKRIDFSGRAVITPSPSLKINEVGLPLRIAVVLFEPFIIHRILHGKDIDRDKINNEIKKQLSIPLSVDSIRKVIKSISNGETINEELLAIFEDICRDVMKDRVVICKRDPVLHAESVRGFYPILVKGDTIQLCTFQVGGFNADFDGDQMAVYHPLTNEAQQEVKMRMMKLQTADSSRSLAFELNKEMYVGLYLLTKDKMKSSPAPLVRDIDLDKVTDPYIPVVYRNHRTTLGRAVFNSALPADFPFVDEQVDKKVVKRIINELVSKYDEKTVIESVHKMGNIGFKFATILAPTFSLDDLDLPPVIYKLKEKLDKVPIEEANSLINRMKDIMVEHLKGRGLYDLVVSGAGKGWDQVTQILIAKGIISDPKGNILPPIKGSFSEGLKPTEFFDAASGARKGLADRVLNTATTGYLARKLAYVLNSVELDPRKEDCGTKRTLSLKLDKDLMMRLEGRYIVKNGKTVLFNKDDFNVGDTIKLRTPIFCESKKICHTCYGKLYERHKSMFIGIIAAQIMSERCTQLLMRTFHTGGAISLKSKDVLRDIAISSDRDDIEV